MKKFLSLLVLSLLLPLAAMADNLDDEFKALSAEDVERHLKKDQAATLKSRNMQTGLYVDAYDTTRDRHLFALGFQFNSNIQEAADILSFEAQYARYMEPAWLLLSASKVSAKFREIAEENGSTGLGGEDLREESNSLLSLGVGWQYRSRWIRTLIEHDRIFETVAAQATYNTLDESFNAHTYKGPGLLASFGIHNRFGANTHIGGKMNYHLMHLTRPEDFEGQTKSARALLLTWVSVGLDLCFYF